MITRRGLGGIAAASLLPTFAAAATPQVRIGFTPLAEYLGAYAAKQEGWFDKHGVDVSFVPIPIVSTIPAALLAGSVDIGAVNAAVFLLGLDGGLDLVAVAGASVTPPGHAPFALVLRPDVPFSGPQSLVGKKILIPGLRSSVDVMFRQWVRAHGVNPESVQTLELASAQTPDALRGTSVDGAVIVEPYLTRVQQDGIAKVASRFADEVDKEVVGTLYIAERSWVEHNPAALSGFRAGLAEGTAFANAKPDDARKDLTPYIKLPQTVLNTLPYPTYRIPIKPDGLQFWIDAMTTEGMLNTKIDVTSIIAS